MPKMTLAEAMRDALDEEMARDDGVYVAGEDVGKHGGTNGETRGLYETYGEERVRDMPILELGIVGHAVGAAAGGLRPVVELWFGDAAAIAGDEIVNQLSKQPYTSAGRLQLPVTVIAPTGGGVAGGAAHSQTVHNWIGHQPGIVAVTASTPYDAKGLLKSAIRDDNPVFFFPHKKLFDMEGEVPDEEYTLPLGETAVKREGADVTVVATQLLLHRTLEAADQLDGEIDVEVLNPRTYAPIDTDTIARSVEKTGHLVVGDEMPLRYGTQGHIVSQIAEANLDAFDAPPKTIGPDDVPVPYSPPLEDEIIPSTDDLVAAIRNVRVE